MLPVLPVEQRMTISFVEWQLFCSPSAANLIWRWTNQQWTSLLINALVQPDRQDGEWDRQEGGDAMIVRLTELGWTCLEKTFSGV